MKNILLLLFTAFLLSACGGPSQSAISSLNYGKQPKRHITLKDLRPYLNFLKDPDTARVTIIQQPAKKGYIADYSSVNSIIVWSGRVGRLSINAKNSYGGYTGYKYYYFTIDKVGLVTGIFNSIGAVQLGLYNKKSALHLVGENIRG